MKYGWVVLLLVWSGCAADERSNRQEDEQAVREQIESFHTGLRRAFRGEAVDVHELFDSLFEESVYSVTYWGVTEPIDSMKNRIERAIPLISDYSSRLEIVSVEVTGDVAYAFFVLRQSYRLGVPMDEYLPTTYVLKRLNGTWKVVHAHRSADRETIERLLDVARARVTADTTEFGGN